MEFAQQAVWPKRRIAGNRAVRHQSRQPNREKWGAESETHDGIDSTSLAQRRMLEWRKPSNPRIASKSLRFALIGLIEAPASMQSALLRRFKGAAARCIHSDSQ